MMTDKKVLQKETKSGIMDTKDTGTKRGRPRKPTGEVKAKAKPTTPWEPAEALHVPDSIKRDMASRGMKPRWVSKTPDRFEKRYYEGYRPYKGDIEVTRPATLIDGSQHDGTKQYRGLILCEIPQDIADARNAYFQKLTDEQMPSR